MYVKTIIRTLRYMLKQLFTSVSVIIVGIYLHFGELSVNCSPKAKWTLLKNRRDEVEEIIQQYGRHIIVLV